MDLNKIKNMVELMRKAFGHYKMQIIAMALVGFAGGVVGGIGIGAIIPLFSFVSHTQSDTPDIVSRFIQKAFSITHLPYSLPALIIAISLLFVAKAIFGFFANYISTKITSDYERDLRNNLFRKTLSASWPYLLDRKIGHLETILITDATRASSVLDTLSGIILFSASLLAYSIVALNISASITIITLGAGVILFFILKPLFFRMRKLSQRWATSSKAVANQVGEYIIGSKTIKAMGAEDKILHKIQKYFDDLRNTRIELLVYGNVQAALQEPTSIILVICIFAFSYSKPGFQFASFLAVIYLVQKMFSFMQSIQGRLSGLNEAIPFLKIITDYKDESTKHIEEPTVGLPEFTFNHSLAFQDVKFTYDERKEILSGISFQANKGEMVGLIGPSGAGKTTVVDLLLKLLEPTNGSILLDDKNIHTISTAIWRKHIGYVSQDIFLLSDTIENNIKFYDTTISDSDMIEAAKMANIYNLIQEQPDKFSTVVGERGVKLSAGQRQRIVLARILARKPEILILDEATSALDNESESLIQTTLEGLKHKMTIIIIAHRLSTVMGCDKLVILEHGKMVEQGTPENLLADKDSYFSKTYNIGAR